jgi:hypothetical protein
MRISFMKLGTPKIIKASIRSTLLAFLCLLIACSSNAISQATPTPDLLDIFSIGTRVFVDANGNGQIDVTDLPLSDVQFTVIGENGVKAIAVTDSNGYASVDASGLNYPVLLQVEAPPNSHYTPLGSGERLMSRDDLRKNGLGAEFLFLAGTP